MPSLNLFVRSGGIGLVSGDIYSGSILDLRYHIQGGPGGIQFRLDKDAPGPIYVGLYNLSGTNPTFNSGGSFSSGGLTDAMPLWPGDAYNIPRYRLTSGIQSVRVLGAAGSSGARLYWEVI